MPALRWWLLWHWSQSTGCCSYSDTKPGPFWWSPARTRSKSFTWAVALWLETSPCDRCWPVCSPSQSCCPAPQRGSSQDLEGWPGSETHPSSCRASWRCWARSRQTPGRSSLLHGRRPRPETGTSPGRPCPRSTSSRERYRTSENAPGNTWSTCFPAEEPEDATALVVGASYLHCNETVVHHDLLCEEIRSYCCFVLVAKLLVHILVHEGGLPNTGTRNDQEETEINRNLRTWLWRPCAYRE